MATPVVSFVITAYRHAKYIDSAIKSCLEQTLQDIEIILVDDGSDDGTADKAALFSDPRLTIIRQKNAGPSLAFNRGLANARGLYVALMSGDDICLPKRLEQQVSIMSEMRLDALFGRPVLIDEKGAVLAHSALDVFFGQAPSSSPNLFQRLFFKGNFLCAPSGMIRRSVFGDCGAFNPALYQLQDFDMWLRLACRYNVHLSDDEVVKYRIRDNHANLSSSVNMRRILIEHAWIYRKLLHEMDANIIGKAFQTDLQLWGLNNAPVEDQKVFVFLSHEEARIRRHGFECLLDRFDRPDGKSGEISFAGQKLQARDLAAMLAVMG